MVIVIGFLCELCRAAFQCSRELNVKKTVIWGF